VSGKEPRLTFIASDGLGLGLGLGLGSIHEQLPVTAIFDGRTQLSKAASLGGRSARPSVMPPRS